MCDALIERFEDWPGTDGRGLPGTAVSPPGEVQALTLALATEVAHTFGTDVSHVKATIVRYDVGDRFARHRDMEPHWPFSYGRTVSFSLLLSDEFDGGDMIVDGHDMALRRGDLAGFNANTWHEIRPVTDGQRYVLVVFGHWLSDAELERLNATGLNGF
ncbi:MAG TPA: 2OG-Fe(II) oxygenase [Thermomicrobiales bacterium]